MGDFQKIKKYHLICHLCLQILKYAFLIVLIPPWFYTIVYKFDLITLIETGFELIFGPKECQTKKEPYLIILINIYLA